MLLQGKKTIKELNCRRNVSLWLTEISHSFPQTVAAMSGLEMRLSNSKHTLHMQSLMKSRNMGREFTGTRKRDKIVVGGSEGNRFLRTHRHKRVDNVP